MTASWKKDLESWYIERLRGVLPDFPLGEVRPAGSPDFTVHGVRETFGIEVTALYRPHVAGQQPMQETERLRSYVVQRAQDVHEARGGPPLSVHACFSPSTQLTRASVATFTKVHELTLSA